MRQSDGFLWLRRAAGSANMQMRPDTRLAQLGLGNPKSAMATLKGCGLMIQDATLGFLGTWALLAMLLSATALAVAFLARYGVVAAWSIAVICLSAAIMKLAPRRYPEGVETLGDLARTAARRNPMLLKAHGAGLRPGDVWLSTRALAAEHSGIAEDEIFPDTPFIQQKAKRHAARA